MNDIEQVRTDKRDTLASRGVNPYPSRLTSHYSISEVVSNSQHAAGMKNWKSGHTVSLSGRVMRSRNAGALIFAVLQSDGARIQVMVDKKITGADAVKDWKGLVDLGDYVSVTGEVITSSTGELSVHAGSWVMASKAISQLPFQNSELSDQVKSRQRYLDVLLNEGTRSTIKNRSRIISQVRKVFEQFDYTEVETPALHPISGGASARPFKTHLNAHSEDVYLRIAPELYLKRCLIAGMENVYEIGKNFRNEGIDSTHTPEFTMLEAYSSYGDYVGARKFISYLLNEVARKVYNFELVTPAEDIPHYDMYTSLSEAVGVRVGKDTDVHSLARTNDVVDSGSHGEVVERLWEELVLPGLGDLFFVTGFPVDTTPLAKAEAARPWVAEKWDLYANGVELATGYSEQNDPEAQRIAFEAQGTEVDEDFLTALKYGMPPAFGIGMGIDRLVAFFEGVSVRETQLFPMVRNGKD